MTVERTNPSGGAANAEQPNPGESARPGSEQQESQASVPNSKYVGEGKTFRTWEDFERAYSEANTKISDQGNELNQYKVDATTLKELADAYGYSTEEVREMINRMKSGNTATTYQREPVKAVDTETQKKLDAMTKEVSNLKRQRQIDELVSATPEAKAFTEQIRNVSTQTGQDPREVWESTFAPVYNQGRDATVKDMERKQETSPSVSRSSAPANASKGYQSALQEALKANPADKMGSDDAWAKVIKERGLFGEGKES